MRAMTRVHPSSYNVLRTLSQDPSTTLVIFSGSGRSRLEEVFGDMPVWLVAENGVFVRCPPRQCPLFRFDARTDVGLRAYVTHGFSSSAFAAGGFLKCPPCFGFHQQFPSLVLSAVPCLGAHINIFRRRPGSVGGAMTREWLKMVDKINLDWMESVQLVFDYFCERTPRSFVEARESSLVWNYKYADVEFGRLQVTANAASTQPRSSAPRRTFPFSHFHTGC